MSSGENRLVNSLDSKYAPVFFGVLSSLLLLWVWSGSSFSAEISDEMAYRLQAEIFAAGKWKLAGRPFPEFFEQLYTFVTPFVASKYPPGHSILLVPGYWFGWPPLMPLVFIGTAGALTFLLARELSSSSIGLVTWAIWLTMPANLAYLPSYLSEVTTLVLWLLGWLALFKRHRGGGARWVVLLAATVAWGIVTRPLTGVLYAVPTVATALYQEKARRELRPALMGAVVGALILLIMPLWSWRTTGDWATTPLSLYTRTYVPWDVPGFDFVQTPPLRPLPADLSNSLVAIIQTHREHSLANLPRIALDRLGGLGAGMWGGWRLIFAPLFVLGFIYLPRTALIGPVTSLLLFTGYLSYAHVSNWVVYYTESFPVCAYVTAVGIGTIFTTSSQLARDSDGARSPVLFPVISRLVDGLKKPFAVRGQATLCTVLALLVLAASIPDVVRARPTINEQTSVRRALLAKIERLPTRRNLIFIHYPESTSNSYLLVANHADLAESEAWVVHDRGTENGLLQGVDRSRAAYTVSVPTRTSEPLLNLSAMTPLNSRSGRGDVPGAEKQ